MPKFGKTSERNLLLVDNKLKEVMYEAIADCPVDFGVSYGHRTTTAQQQLYAQGRTQPGKIVTNIDGVHKLSKHNYNPSKAVDIVIADKTKAYDEATLAFVAGWIMATAKRLNIDITWGGNWDNDYTILTDQKLIDMPHFEID